MYEITVTREFAAAHALVIQGEREPLHGHNWRVTAAVAGPALNADGLLCDFHEVERALDDVIAPWRNGDLSGSPLFARANASAENVARAVSDGLAARLAHSLPTGTGVAWVRVTEAPGCAATYRQDSTP